MAKSLWDATDVKGLHCKNRFWRAATWEAMATEDGRLTQELFELYVELARGGVGTILTGYNRVREDERPNHRMLGIFDDSFIEDYRELTDAVHAEGASIVLQVAYGGAHGTPDAEPGPVWGPSAVPHDINGCVPVEMTEADIAELVGDYASAARRAKAAGFDGVQIHSGHGYLLSQWLCPHYNKREDGYGGELENRARIHREIIRAVRAEVGGGFAVGIKLNSEDCMSDGLTQEESLQVAKMLQDVGLDFLEVSGGNEASVEVHGHNLGPVRKGLKGHPERESYFAGYARKAAELLDIPVLLTGGNRDFGRLEALLNDSEIAWFGFSRPLIAEPDLVNRWREDEAYELKCLACSKCHGPQGMSCILHRKEG